MVSNEDKSLLEGDYKVSVETRLSDDKESVTATVSISDNLHELFKDFSCTNMPPVEHNVFNSKIKRYPIKKSLLNSVDWRDSMSLLFSKDMMDNKCNEFNIGSVSIAEELSSVFERDAIQLAEKAIKLKAMEKGRKKTVSLKPTVKS